ncbi:MAG: MaoC family dehydratase [Pseudomonadota bacterium]
MQSPSYLDALYSHLRDSARIPPATQIKNYVLHRSILAQGDEAPPVVTLEEARLRIGQEVGVTNWFPITQDQVNRFADATGDYQFLHIDQDRAIQESCYGGTIAHGLLILSLLPMFSSQGSLKIRGTRSKVIYGMDRLRFTNPVRIGKRIRARFTLLSAEERCENEVMLRHQVTIEIENEEKPALIADWAVVAIQ